MSISFDVLPDAARLAVLEEVALAALSQYDIGGTPRVRLLNLSENATYSVEGGDRRYALRVHRDGYHSAAAIASELSWAVALRDAGKALLIVSVELEEILGLADRILVLAGGEIVGELSRAEATEEKIGLMMAGVKVGGAA